MAGPRVERIEFQGQVAWRKRFGGPSRRLRLALLRWLARRLGLSPLIAPIPLTAAAACATEADMIGRLAALGVHVPEVLKREDDQLVLAHLGQTLGALLKRESSPDVRETLLRRAFEALLDLHRRGGYVSQAVVRNLTLDGDRVGFIDLEEDPALMMPLASAQARDALLFVQSSARFLSEHPERFGRLLKGYLGAETAEVRQEVLDTAHRLRWLARPACWFGERARACGLALSVLAEARAQGSPFVSVDTAVD